MDLTAIVTCKDRANIKFCIESMRFCNPRPNCILVDFGSSTPIKYSDYESWLKVIRVNRNTNIFHKARAINIGIRAATSKYICITDADQLFQPNFFGAVLGTLQISPKALVMCRTYSLAKLPTSCGFDVSGKYYGELLYQAKHSGIRFHGDGCCNGLLLEEAIKIHGYDESYTGYRAQDSDFALRASRNGLRRFPIDGQTSMIHLPHSRVGLYYSNSNIVRNRAKYYAKKRNKIRIDIIANFSNSWGLL